MQEYSEYFFENFKGGGGGGGGGGGISSLVALTLVGGGGGVRPLGVECKDTRLE